MTRHVLHASKATAQRRSEAHELRIALSVDPASLSPLVAFSQNRIAYDQLFCHTLVGLSADNRVVPILVTRVPSRANGDISPDGTRVTGYAKNMLRYPVAPETWDAER